MAPKKAETLSYSITISTQASEMLEELVETGLYGGNRAEVSRQLILDQLKKLVAEQVIRNRSK